MKKNMEQFPAKNPNPVISVENNGTVIYSNAAGIWIRLRFKTSKSVIFYAMYLGIMLENRYT